MSLACAIDHSPHFHPIADITPIVFVVDEEVFIRKSLERVIRSEGWQPETFESAQEFLTHPRSMVPNCLIFALSPPGPDGLELQKQIARDSPEMPIIFISGFRDIPTTVQAMKAGAVDFLLKPFSNDVLMNAIHQSLHDSRLVLDREMKIYDLRNCYAPLTTRGRQVMTLVVSGLLNKQVAGELGISEVTVKAHRGQVTKKMKANSLADLVRMAVKLRPSREAIHLA
jgi:FixJ family two-component response regulator